MADLKSHVQRVDAAKESVLEKGVNILERKLLKEDRLAEFIDLLYQDNVARAMELLEDIFSDSYYDALDGYKVLQDIRDSTEKLTTELIDEASV